MSKIIIQNIVYELSDYDDEKEIENALNLHANQIFGKNRIYLDFKKKIGQKNKTIPDGYLLDFSSSKLFSIFSSSHKETNSDKSSNVFSVLKIFFCTIDVFIIYFKKLF